MRDALDRSDEIKSVDNEAWAWLAKRIRYTAGDLSTTEVYDGIEAVSRRDRSGRSDARPQQDVLSGGSAECVRDQYRTSLDKRADALLKPPDEEPWARVVIEKPFGRSLETAQKLNRVRARPARTSTRSTASITTSERERSEHSRCAVRESDLRAAVEQAVRRRMCRSPSAETVGVETRGKYYEEAGIIRDMFQNHLLQLLTLTAMEPPIAYNGDEVRDEKVKVLRSVRSLVGNGDPPVVLGQYAAGEVDGEHLPGYREEKNVAPKSSTPTFAAMRFTIDNWRWRHVPFYLRSGKRLAQRSSEIAIQFRSPPVLLFGQAELADKCPSTLVMRIQPDEGISLRFNVKTPGAENELTPHLEIAPVDMDFSYTEAFKAATPPAYQTLLLDIMIGDQTLFTRSDEVESSWQIIDPLIKYLERRKREIPKYPAGTWGPAESDELLRGAHSRWR